MRRAVIASVVVIGFALPASAETKFFVVSDTVGNCSVVEGGYSAGLSPIGNKDGYASGEDARVSRKCARTPKCAKAS